MARGLQKIQAQCVHTPRFCSSSSRLLSRSEADLFSSNQPNLDATCRQKAGDKKAGGKSNLKDRAAAFKVRTRGGGSPTFTSPLPSLHPFTG